MGGRLSRLRLRPEFRLHIAGRACRQLLPTLTKVRELALFFRARALKRQLKVSSRCLEASQSHLATRARQEGAGAPDSQSDGETALVGQHPHDALRFPAVCGLDDAGELCSASARVCRRRGRVAQRRSIKCGREWLVACDLARRRSGNRLASRPPTLGPPKPDTRGLIERYLK